MSDLWLAESVDVAEEQTHQRYVAARAATAPVFQFLASATSRNDYESRKDLQSERITTECARLASGADVAVLASQVMQAMDHDFNTLLTLAELERNERLAVAMRRQHFNNIADTLYSYQQKVGHVPGLADHFSSSLASTNQAFNAERFKQAANSGRNGGGEAPEAGGGSNVMTRQHFQHIADTIKNFPDPVHRRALAEHFAGHLAGTNPQFNSKRFIEAATGSGYKQATVTGAAHDQDRKPCPVCHGRGVDDGARKDGNGPGSLKCPGGCQGAGWVYDPNGKKTATAPGRSPKQLLYRHLMDAHGLEGKEKYAGSPTGYIPPETPHATLSLMHDREHAAGNDHPGIDSVSSLHSKTSVSHPTCENCGKDVPSRGGRGEDEPVYCSGDCADADKPGSKTAGMAWSPASGMGNRDHANRTYKPTHEFHPNGWDQFDARPHPGSHPIAGGSQVMSHGKMDPSGLLIHVQDDEGNHQTVDRRSLKPLGFGRSGQPGGHSYTGETNADGYHQTSPEDAGPKGEWTPSEGEASDPGNWSPEHQFGASLRTTASDHKAGLEAGIYTIDAFGGLSYVAAADDYQDEDEAEDPTKPMSKEESFLGDEVPWGQEPSHVDNAPDMHYHCAHEEHIPEAHRPYAHEARFNAPAGKTCKYCNKDMSGEPARMVHGMAFADASLTRGASKTAAYSPNCRHCGRDIVNDKGTWVDPHASGDDAMWRETCDSNDTFDSPHEPGPATRPDALWHSEKMAPPSPPRNEHLNSKVKADKHSNFDEKCPICGKEIPKYLMDHHMATQHPHEVSRTGSKSRQPCPVCNGKGQKNSAQCKACQGTGWVHKDEEDSFPNGFGPTQGAKKPGLWQRMWKRAAGNPFADSESNPFDGATSVDQGGQARDNAANMSMSTVPKTTHPAQKPADNPNAVTPPQQVSVIPVIPQGGAAPNQGNAATQGFANDSGPKTSSVAAKIATVASAIIETNPGIDEERAFTLAAKTVMTFPNMVKDAVGGADYEMGDGEEDETLTDCPQCGRAAFSSDLGKCHNCGYRTTRPVTRPGYDSLKPTHPGVNR